MCEIAALLVPLILVGCQPEGTGTLKPASGTRPPDSALGRPFGNPPDMKKKPSTKDAAREEETSKKLENPRL